MVETNTSTPDRLDTIESRLHRLEEMLAQWLGPRLPWLPRASAMAPMLLPPAFIGMSAEIKEKRRQLRETAVQPWQHLVRRQHLWRKQLYVKGRNLTARQLVGSIKANQLDVEKAAIAFDLSVEAVREALAYVEQNRELLETEAQIERLMLQRGGVARGPQPVS